MSRVHFCIEEISTVKAEDLCRKIIIDLPEYFGLPDANDHYAIGVCSRQNFAAKIEDDYIGLISLEFPYPNTCSIYWLAISRHYHRKGIGSKLIQAAQDFAIGKGAKTMTIETLAPCEAEENYLKTYNFYLSQGFAPLFNLKPQEYEWTMVYMVKSLKKIELLPKHLSINLLKELDMPLIIRTFSEAAWPKPLSTFEQYWQEQEKSERLVWVARINNQIAGYVTLRWKSHYQPFLSANIPEIMDLNVLPRFRKVGLGSRLLEVVEKEAALKTDRVGLGVGLYGGPDGGYGAAQKLYVKRGYIPDGKGITYNYRFATPGKSFPLDDDLILWFTKRLK